MEREKFTHEEKLEAVLNVIKKHMSQQESAELSGVSTTHIQRLIKRYETFGVEGLLMKHHGTYDGQFKIDVVEYMHTHQLSTMETAVKFGIPNDSSVCLWERIYYEEGREGLIAERRGRKRMSINNANPKKPKLNKNVEEDLIAEVQRLRMENAYLKKLNALVRERTQRENGKK